MSRIVLSNMTSSKESVEIVEATWNVPNFRQFASKGKEKPETLLYSSVSRYAFFIGETVPPADPQLGSGPLKSSLVKLEAFISFCGTSAWKITFCVADRSKLPSGCILRGKILELKVSADKPKSAKANRKTILGKRGLAVEPIDFSATDFSVALLEQAEVDNWMHKSDGFLHIYFKLEMTFSIPRPNATHSVTGNFTACGFEALKDFEALLKNPTNGDVVIQVSLGKGQFFQCHKGILAARSPIFRAMFASDMKETKESIVEVHDILPKAMEHFLSFLYCGRFQDSSWIESLPQLAYASDKYCVKSLRNLCDSHLIESVTLRNALTLGKLAERHGLTKAAKDIRAFIAENADKVNLDIEVFETSNSEGNFDGSSGSPSSFAKTAETPNQD